MFQKGIASRGWWKPDASKRYLNITPELQPLKRNRCVTSVKHRNIPVSYTHLTERKSNILIKKLEKLLSKHEAQKLQRQVYVSGRIKTMNESIYYTVDAIHNAISENRKIRFQYFQWLSLIHISPSLSCSRASTGWTVSVSASPPSWAGTGWSRCWRSLWTPESARRCWTPQPRSLIHI